MKDNFSGHAFQYAKFRPGYPEGFYDFILSHLSQRQAAWDCATGNGQVAHVLSRYFDKVEATDISEQQLQNAPRLPNIRYSVQPAEKTDFEDHAFDLIVVAQAVHWFDFMPFFSEVKRTLRTGGMLALVGYGLIEVEGIGGVINHFYESIIGPYWDQERKYIENQYRDIPFPLEELEVPEMTMEYQWEKEQLLGYLHTWSAVKHYEKALGKNPLYLIRNDIDKAWGRQKSRKVTFPLILKVGRNPNRTSKR